MTREQIAALLALAAAYDRRTVGQADLAAWSDAAEREGWTWQLATDAIKAHYARSTAWLMPGHITAHHDAHRPGRSQPPAFQRQVSRRLPTAEERHAAFAAGLRQAAAQARPEEEAEARRGA